MQAIKIAKHAQKQLEGIYHYSITNWGAQKAQNYLAELYKTMQLLAITPNISLKYEDSLYYFPSQNHIIYFQQKPAELVIIAVLHKKSLPNNDPILAV